MIKNIESALGITKLLKHLYLKSNEYSSFEILMASEEQFKTRMYLKDGFGFLLEKNRTPDLNLAVLPDGDGDPTNNIPVSVINLNS